MKHYYNYPFLMILTFLLSMSSCNSCNDTDKDGINDENDKCPKVFGKSKDGCPIVKEIGNIHFYIETSASMGGYFQKDAEYLEIISDLTSKIEKNIKPIDIWFTAETTTKYNKSTQQFSSDIATTKIADQNGSQLDKIISNIASKNDSNDVSVFVSDCILSFPDDIINADPSREINKYKANSTLKNSIYSTFADLNKKGLATSIYAFTSKFYTNEDKKIYYYDYQNKHVKINGNKRPFYVWVIASKEILSKFNNKLNDISSFKPEKYLHFGLNEQPITKYSIIPQIEHEGQWMKCKDGIEEIKLDKTNPIQFCVALNLEDLPAYAQDTKYLQKNLKIENKGCDISFEFKDKSKVNTLNLTSPKQNEDFVNATHIIIFKLNSMSLSEATVGVSLPLHYDTWYLDWSCMDDKTATAFEGKTFALEHLIAGVKEAYETKNKKYIDFTITLNK